MASAVTRLIFGWRGAAICAVNEDNGPAMRASRKMWHAQGSFRLRCNVNHLGGPMKLSARNIFKGKIVEVTKGQTTAHVRIGIGGAIVTASITNEAVDELRLAAGQSASAIIKA